MTEMQNKTRFPWVSELGVRVLAAIAIGLMITGYAQYKVSYSDFYDTDNPPIRSGLRVFTDQRTHCQYVSEGNGLTARLDQHGDPMCGPP